MPRRELSEPPARPAVSRTAMIANRRKPPQTDEAGRGAVRSGGWCVFGGLASGEAAKSGTRRRKPRPAAGSRGAVGNSRRAELSGRRGREAVGGGRSSNTRWLFKPERKRSATTRNHAQPDATPARVGELRIGVGGSPCKGDDETGRCVVHRAVGGGVGELEVQLGKMGDVGMLACHVCSTLPARRNRISRKLPESLSVLEACQHKVRPAKPQKRSLTVASRRTPALRRRWGNPRRDAWATDTETRCGSI
jgi:hypothetical protein